MHRMIFYGDKQKPIMDEEQDASEELDVGETDAESEAFMDHAAENSAFDTCTDEELLIRIRSCDGDEALDYLINKYRNFVRSKARSYFLIGADREDIVQEELIDIEQKMEEILSDLEWRVLMSYLDGKSYQEIAVDLHRQVKSIDNALQRVKRKLEKYMESRGEDLDIGIVYRGLTTINRVGRAQE